MSEENLKPCPFCGKTPVVHRGYGTYVVLHSCDAIKTNIRRGSLKAVSEKWNTRAGDTPINIDEIKAALEDIMQQIENCDSCSQLNTEHIKNLLGQKTKENE